MATDSRFFYDGSILWINDGTGPRVRILDIPPENLGIQLQAYAQRVAQTRPTTAPASQAATNPG